MVIAGNSPCCIKLAVEEGQDYYYYRSFPAPIPGTLCPEFPRTLLLKLSEKGLAWGWNPLAAGL
jgi:hypothetical protein